MVFSHQKEFSECISASPSWTLNFLQSNIYNNESLNNGMKWICQKNKKWQESNSHSIQIQNTLNPIIVIIEIISSSSFSSSLLGLLSKIDIYSNNSIVKSLNWMWDLFLCMFFEPKQKWQLYTTFNLFLERIKSL